MFRASNLITHVPALGELQCLWGVSKIPGVTAFPGPAAFWEGWVTAAQKAPDCRGVGEDFKGCLRPCSPTALCTGRSQRLCKSRSAGGSLPSEPRPTKRANHTLLNANSALSNCPFCRLRCPCTRLGNFTPPVYTFLRLGGLHSGSRCLWEGRRKTRIALRPWHVNLPQQIHV